MTPAFERKKKVHLKYLVSYSSSKTSYVDNFFHRAQFLQEDAFVVKILLKRHCKYLVQIGRKQFQESK